MLTLWWFTWVVQKECNATCNRMILFNPDLTVTKYMIVKTQQKKTMELVHNTN